MRHIYEGNGEITTISDEAENLVDSVAAALIGQHSHRAYLLAQAFQLRARDEGMEIERRNTKDWAERENRERAEFGRGKAEFRTLDGGTFHDDLSIERGRAYPRIWKRACRPEMVGCIQESMSPEQFAIQIRTYEFTGISRQGLPIYLEMHP